MIKNIIFDMGNVIVSYQPEVICAKLTDNEKDANLILNELFNSDEWRKLDAGEIEEDEVIKIICDRLPERLHKIFKYIFLHWHEYQPPKKDVEEIVKLLKEKGYKIYLCSNAAARFKVYKNDIPAFKYFDGFIVSAFEKCVKPDAKIYNRLFERFNINPSESFFIDDLPHNIEGAKKCGMNGYLFESGKAEDLKNELLSRGIL